MKYIIEFNLIYNNHIKSLFFYKEYTDRLTDYQIDFEVENLALILEKECKVNIQKIAFYDNPNNFNIKNIAFVKNHFSKFVKFLEKFGFTLA